MPAKKPKQIESDLFAEERRLEILERVRKDQKVAVNELARAFGVSGVTIRKDLRSMEDSGLLTRTHGGAIVKSKMGIELNTRQKRARHQDEKRRMALAALDLIEDGDRLLLDTGTSTLELSRALSQRKDLTVVTNDLDIAGVLEESTSIEVILLGGILRKGFRCTVSLPGMDTRSRLTVDKAFMGTNGFDVERGATTPDIRQAETKRHMLSMANKIYLLCDSSKFDRVAFAQFSGPDEIDGIVTDRLDAKRKRELERVGLEIIMAAD